MINLHLPNIALINYLSAGQSLLPLVIIALLIDAGIIAIWYGLGVVLNDRRYKASARGEIGQLLGTAAMIGIIIAVLAFSAGVMYAYYNSTTLMSPSVMSTMCKNIENGNSGFLTGYQLLGSSQSLLAGNGNGNGGATTGNFPGLCNLLSPSSSDIGTEIDYPLAASGVIIANLTNQSVGNLNSLYYIVNFVSFLQNLEPKYSVCVAADIVPTKALLGCLPFLGTLTSLTTFTYQPFSGLDAMVKLDGGTVGSLQIAEVEALTLQLIVIVIALYAWPYILFVGLLLRSTFLTRRVGGMFIAIAIGVIFFAPILLSLEYFTLAGGSSQISNTVAAGTYGFNTITDLNASSAAAGSNGNYLVNFFVQPSFKAIAQKNSCWAGTGATYILNIGADLYYLANPITTGLKGIFGLIGVSQGAALINPNLITPYLPVSCNYQNAFTMSFQLIEANAVGGITSYFLPLMNVIIVLAGIKGLSGVLGGDTTLAGLGKLV